MNIYDPQLDANLRPTNPHYIYPSDVLASYPNDFAAIQAGCSYNNIQAEMMRTYDLRVPELNGYLVDQYKAEFAAFLEDYNNGRKLATSAPKVPLAYTIKYAVDGQTLIPYMSYGGGGPVTTELTIPTPIAPIVPIPGKVSIGGPVISNPGWFHALPDDGVLRGVKVTGTALDGTSGTFTKFTNPFGESLYLLKDNQ